MNFSSFKYFLFFLFAVFFFFFFFFGMYLFNNVCWGGVFIFQDSYMFVLLIFMSIFILSILVMVEKNNQMMMLSVILVLICLFFFLSSNMLMLYIYFEISILPVVVMILGYGSQIEKINSTYYLLVYASVCSMPFLYVYFLSDFFVIFCYFDYFLSWEFVFFVSVCFMMKFPVYFLHLWLPKAHVEAPTTASMLLAGLLLKLGTSGFLRIMGSLSFVYVNFFIFISILGMILATFCCIFQSDSKSFAAYSSVAHMGFLLFSLVLFCVVGKTSALILMLAHGYTSTLMFYFIGLYYHVKGNRIVYFMNSIFGSGVIFGIFFSLVFLSNSGVPPSLSFFSEFMTVLSGWFIFNDFFFFMFIYFLFSFYYSMFLITNSLVGTTFFNFIWFDLGFSFPVLFMCYNIFWICIYY